MSNKIHQIWISKNNTTPENVLEYVETFKALNPDKEHILWTNDNLSEFNFKYQNGIPEAYQTDILRLEILTKYGGWYIDADMVCIRPLSELEKVIALDINNITVTLSSFNGLLANGMFYVPLGFNFDTVLNAYEPVRTMIQEWDRWLKKENKNYDVISFDLVGYNGEFIKDLRFSSWNRKRI